jgi:hypothetical protein
MAQPQAAITLTLHWQVGAGPRSATIACEDSPPRDLLPLLVAGCGLPARDERGAPIDYRLHLGAAGGRLLAPGVSLGAQGVCDGGQLWLRAARPAAGGPHRCALSLPVGGGLILPPGGLALSRGWLLGALELLSPAAHQRELALLDSRQSIYRFVSNRTHCALTPAGPGRWQALTERDDVATLLNEAPLSPRRPAPLADGDSLRLGHGGPMLTIALI